MHAHTHAHTHTHTRTHTHTHTHAHTHTLAFTNTQQGFYEIFSLDQIGSSQGMVALMYIFNCSNHVKNGDLIVVLVPTYIYSHIGNIGYL